MHRIYGLIGYPLKHSFSKKYFTEKFRAEQIEDASYQQFEIDDIDKVREVFRTQGLQGINVTIPYKQAIIQYLDDLDHSAKNVGAVNVIKLLKDGRKIGYNSDYYGFKLSLERWADLPSIQRAFILGSGGASKAVQAVLQDLNIPFQIVSRSTGKGDITYEEINNNKTAYEQHQLIINATPLGTFPDITARPDLCYEWLSGKHYLYDLVYNPEVTQFMQDGQAYGAHVKNGHEMLVLQAEKSWEIWNN